MNNHLNLYKPYYQSENQQDIIENNLTRALVIAMQNNALLFYKVIELILEKAHPTDSKIAARSFFTSIRNSEDIQFEVQLSMRNMEEELFDGGVIAVTLTTDYLDMSQFETMACGVEKDVNRITDVIITVKDTLVIIEVKRNSIDCRQQLYDQVHYLKEKGNRIRGASITWGEIISILYTISSMQKVAYEKNVFTEDMINLLEEYMPGIIPSFPFYETPFTFDPESVEWIRMKQRLHQSVMGIEEISSYKLRYYSDRSPVDLNWPWAKEVSFGFSGNKLEERSVDAYIWPANTKGQGWYVYNRSLEWLNKKELKVGKATFKLEISYEVKFCHFNRYVTSFKFTDTELAPGMKLHTKKNFEKTGKYRRNGNDEYTWKALAKWLDDYFIDSFKWREQCDWQGNFKKSERSYLTVSFGFEVKCIIPYKYLQNIDKKDTDYKIVSTLFKDIVDAYANMLDNKN